MPPIVHYGFVPGGQSLDELEGAVRETVEGNVLDEVDDSEKLESNPSTDQHGNSVTLRLVNVICRWSDLHDVPAPLGIYANNVDDYHAVTIDVYRRVGGEFVEIDSFSTQMWGRASARLYGLCNYGLEPKVDYSRLEPLQSPGDVEFRPWSETGIEAEEPPAFDADRGRSAASLEELVGNRDWTDGDFESGALVDDPAWYHVAARELRDRGYTPDENVVEALNSKNRECRDAAARRIAASDPGIERYKTLLEALPALSPEAQHLVAPVLWRPPYETDRGHPDVELANALAGVANCEHPAARIGAISGLGHFVGATFESYLHDETVPDQPTRPSPATEVLDAFEHVLWAAFHDDHRYVQFRAASLVGGLLYGGERDMVALRDDALWHALTFDQRWRLARAAAAVDDYEACTPSVTMTITGAEDEDWFFEDVYDGDPTNLGTLVEYAWDDPGPRAETVRAVVASIAEDDPDAVVEYLDRPLAAIQAGDETPADPALVAELASTVPSRLVEFASVLEPMLDGDGEKRRAAARALATLASARPDAVDLPADALTEAAIDLRDEHGKLIPERVRTLTIVDPDTAVALFKDLFPRMNDDDGEHERSLTGAYYEAARADPQVVLDTHEHALDAITVADCGKPSLEDAAVAFATAAAKAPEQFADDVPALRDWIAVFAPRARTAIADVLTRVAAVQPAAIPADLEPVVDRRQTPASPEALRRATERSDVTVETPQGWPLGDYAHHDPDAAVERIRSALYTDAAFGERRRELLWEIYDRDTDVGYAVLRELLTRDPEVFVGRRGGGGGFLLLRDAPDRAVAVVDALVALVTDSLIQYWRSDRARLTTAAKRVEELLVDAAEADPARVRRAIEQRYEDVDAFVADTETRHPRRVRNALDTE